MRAGRVSRPAIEACVKRIERIEFYAGELRRECQVNLTTGVCSNELLLVNQGWQRYSECSRITDEFDERQQAWNITICFFG